MPQPTSYMATLLYVDDEETIGRVVERYFSRRGDTVYLARSLTEAREILATREPSAVIIDVQLGGESGFELLRWIEERRPVLADRVTFVTGDLVDVADAQQGEGSMGRRVIQKPFDLSTLATVVDGVALR